jgi:hypothetical protein
MSAPIRLCYDGCGRPARPDADVCTPCADAELARLRAQADDQDELAALEADERFSWAVGK